MEFEACRSSLVSPGIIPSTIDFLAFSFFRRCTYYWRICHFFSLSAIMLLLTIAYNDRIQISILSVFPVLRRTTWSERKKGKTSPEEELLLSSSSSFSASSSSSLIQLHVFVDFLSVLYLFLEYGCSPLTSSSICCEHQTEIDQERRKEPKRAGENNRLHSTKWSNLQSDNIQRRKTRDFSLSLRDFSR